MGLIMNILLRDARRRRLKTLAFLCSITQTSAAIPDATLSADDLSVYLSARIFMCSNQRRIFSPLDTESELERRCLSHPFLIWRLL
ncbi:hypothetical protein GALMADRAFT_254775 [Galerina marginata CBS 339.88]|uniref:Uncharacterized protein n=1 Tax=Galerina marginata (strain CBS 339.88) TaxID=685588 RepID=A0A067SVD4_GALM3|nr:hypothetical protein GALMADRAFT_254775 [Galerina marginata CBS 339.88]